jgi:hypothetical protein
VGGIIDVQIAGNEGVSTVGLDLFSSDDAILTVAPVADVASPTWRLSGVAPGAVRLQAIDGEGAVVDYIEIDVVGVAGYTLDLLGGDAVGPTTADAYDEVWTIAADAAVSFQAIPTIEGGAKTMGRYFFNVTLDDALAEGLIQTNTTGGYLYFKVPAGDHTAALGDLTGHGLRVLFSAR